MKIIAKKMLHTLDGDTLLGSPSHACGHGQLHLGYDEFPPENVSLFQVILFSPCTWIVYAAYHMILYYGSMGHRL